MSGFGQEYAATRQRITRLVSDLDDEALGQLAPATPAWSIRDLVSHVTGVAADMVSGNLAEVGQPAWTQSQVDQRRSRSVDEILDEWRELSPRVEEALAVIHPAIAGLALADLVTHEHDIRGAVNDTGARESEAMHLATDAYVRTVGRALKKAEIPALDVEAEEQRWTMGTGEPGAGLRTIRFELFRAIAGRRSKDQVLAFEWEGDPEPYVEHLSLFGYRQDPLVE